MGMIISGFEWKVSLWECEFTLYESKKLNLENPFQIQTTFTPVEREDGTIVYTFDGTQKRKVFTDEDKKKWRLLQNEYVVIRVAQEYGFEKAWDYCNNCQNPVQLQTYLLMQCKPCFFDGQCMLNCKFYDKGCKEK